MRNLLIDGAFPLLTLHRGKERANIVQNLYFGKCTGKRDFIDFTLQNFLFRQNMCPNLKFLTA
jgi:hypothetical protein